MDKETKSKLERGKRLVEVFKQDQYQPVSIAGQVVVFYGITAGYFDNVPVEKVHEFEIGLLEYVNDLNSKSSDLTTSAEPVKASFVVVP